MGEKDGLNQDIRDVIKCKNTEILKRISQKYLIDIWEMLEKRGSKG